MRRSARSLSSSTLLVNAAAIAFLLVRLAPDVKGKPLFEDEAVAGLISARPFGEVLQTVLLDRGGAPLHFVLAHLTLAVDSSPSALRWLSVVFAVATIPLCFDLARRLSGSLLAGATAAALATTSQLLGIYGTFGRMYSLFAFASALAIDLFVRAVDDARPRTQLAALASALLTLAVHPFGVFVFAAELLVAAWLWGPRVLAAGALAVPFLLPDLRLADRYEGGDLGGYATLEATLRALGGAAGGYGLTLILFAAVAVLGLKRRWLALVIVVPPAALTVAAALDLTSDRLSPRHLIFMLPVWIALVAMGVSRLPLPILAAAGAVAIAVFAPSAVSDPRKVDRPEHRNLQLERGDVMYPYAAVFLGALPEATAARGFPREPVALARIAKRTRHVPKVFVAVTLPDTWLVLERRGPFATGADALRAAVGLLGDVEPNASVRQLRGAACAALRRLRPRPTARRPTAPRAGSSCVPPA